MVSLPRLLTLLLAFLASAGVATAHDVGDRVVVVESADAMIESGVIGRVHPGAVFVVQHVNGDWLWPNLPKPGWIPASSVMSLDNAVTRFTGAISKNARDAQSYWARGQVQRARGDRIAALRDFDNVVRLAPGSHLGYLSRGVCHYEAEKWDDAAKDFDRAIECKEDCAAALHLRHLVHAAKGEWKKSMALLDRVIEESPMDARGFNARAWLRATCPDAEFRDGKAAVADAKQACRLTGSLNFKCLGTLAAAHAEAGQFDEAVERQNKAIELAPSEFHASFRKRLKLYEAKKAYHAERGGEIR